MTLLTDTIRFDPSDRDTAAFFNEATIWSAPFGRLMLEHLPMRDDIRVLDVGCATGFPLLVLADRLGRRSECVGLDPWAAAIAHLEQKIAYQRLPQVRAVLGSAAAMPFGDGAFDLVVSNLGINNFDDPPAVVRECRRVLAPGGTIALTTNLVGHMRGLYSDYEAALAALGLAQYLEALRAQEHHRATVEGTHALFAAVGMAPAQVVERAFAMRFASGAAFLESFFVRFSFVAGWRSVVPDDEWPRVAAALAARLDARAAEEGGLSVRIPMAYLAYWGS